ncbi:MAG: hypothetical protein LBK91_07620, partial [Synergistaceae bacterium]|nr:hypothetical protein [Synergistaceae bacterium]
MRKLFRFFTGKKSLVRERADRKILYGQIGLGLLILGAWEFCSRLSVNSFWFSRPSLIFARILKMMLDGSIWYHLSATLSEILIGLLAGMTIGVTLGILSAYSGMFQYWVSPY